MFDEEQLGFLAGDEYQRAADLRQTDARFSEAADRQADDYPTPAARARWEAQEALAEMLGRRAIVTAVAMPPPARQTGPVWTDSNPGEVGK